MDPPPRSMLQGRLEVVEQEIVIRPLSLSQLLAIYQGHDVRVTVELLGDPRLRTERSDLLEQVRKAAETRRAMHRAIDAGETPSLAALVQQATDFAEELAELDLDAILRELERDG